MKKRTGKIVLVMVILAFSALFVIPGCTGSRHKLDDFKQYFLNDVARW